MFKKVSSLTRKMEIRVCYEEKNNKRNHHILDDTPRPKKVKLLTSKQSEKRKIRQDLRPFSRKQHFPVPYHTCPQS
jgi:hypothetical protein